MGITFKAVQKCKGKFAHLLFTLVLLKVYAYCLDGVFHVLEPKSWHSIQRNLPWVQHVQQGDAKFQHHFHPTGHFLRCVTGTVGYDRKGFSTPLDQDDQ